MPTTTTTNAVTVEVLLDAMEWTSGLRRDARAGLTGVPKELPPTWLYDERGSELFDRITRLPEYYPTRTERAILHSRAVEIAAHAGADTLVELGSGTADKTDVLLDAMADTGLLRRYVPFDVAEPTLRASAERVAAERPGLRVHGIVGDFRRHLRSIPDGGRRLVAFLGGTIGNLQPADRSVFLGQVAASMHAGDALLLGTDLVKDPARLVSAYDDASGVTAEFDKNVLRVLNRELGADFDPDRFDHVARFDQDEEWIEMRLRSRGEQVVHVPALGITVPFADGEDLRTEISAKFRRALVEQEVAAAGLRLSHWWTDPAGDYALSLSVP